VRARRCRATALGTRHVRRSNPRVRRDLRLVVVKLGARGAKLSDRQRRHSPPHEKAGGHFAAETPDKHPHR
jgi:hypothetical protein